MPISPRLTPVGPPDQAAATPPRPLGPAGRHLWDRITGAYDVWDEGGRAILWECCAAADRAEQLAERINKDGPILEGRNGPREHPALRQELACRSFITH